MSEIKLPNLPNLPNLQNFTGCESTEFAIWNTEIPVRLWSSTEKNKQKPASISVVNSAVVFPEQLK